MSKADSRLQADEYVAAVCQWKPQAQQLFDRLGGETHLVQDMVPLSLACCQTHYTCWLNILSLLRMTRMSKDCGELAVLLTEKSVMLFSFAWFCQKRKKKENSCFNQSADSLCIQALSFPKRSKINYEQNQLQKPSRARTCAFTVGDLGSGLQFFVSLK